MNIRDYLTSNFKGSWTLRKSKSSFSTQTSVKILELLNTAFSRLQRFLRSRSSLLRFKLLLFVMLETMDVSSRAVVAAIKRCLQEVWLDLSVKLSHALVVAFLNWQVDALELSLTGLLSQRHLLSFRHVLESLIQDLICLPICIFNADCWNSNCLFGVHRFVWRKSDWISMLNWVSLTLLAIIFEVFGVVQNHFFDTDWISVFCLDWHGINYLRSESVIAMRLTEFLL